MSGLIDATAATVSAATSSRAAWASPTASRGGLPAHPRARTRMPITHTHTHALPSPHARKITSTQHLAAPWQHHPFALSSTGGCKGSHLPQLTISPNRASSRLSSPSPPSPRHSEPLPASASPGHRIIILPKPFSHHASRIACSARRRSVHQPLPHPGAPCALPRHHLPDRLHLPCALRHPRSGTSTCAEHSTSPISPASIARARHPILADATSTPQMGRLRCALHHRRAAPVAHHLHAAPTLLLLLHASVQPLWLLPSPPPRVRPPGVTPPAHHSDPAAPRQHAAATIPPSIATS